ncbi:Apolipoprotein/apolipophorin [Madurella fahalii]|uniref:Apolipoprotein/apolipophorin n=1 Tax=Madurella fahalii TaxID=1157608 RepID=A0ABQ0GQ07_9PEZI
MLPSRFATRVAPGASRGTRLLRYPRSTQRCFQSTTTTTGGANSSHFMSGVAGGMAGASLLYGIYIMTPSGKMARKLNAAARETDKRYQQVAATIKDKTPNTDEAVDKIKQVCYSYVAWVPGGRQYVDAAFNDFAAIRENHSEEVDKIVDETYREFQDIARAGLSIEAASKAYDALTDLAKKLASLSGSAADQILERHPQLKEKVGGPINQLKQMGAQYGPEARKLVDDTWKQINDVMASGFSSESADKVRRLVDDRTQQLRRIGDDLWEKGLEQAKPYLDKSPEVKELVMGNQDILKEGNVAALFKQVRRLGEVGDTGKLEDYVKQAVDKAKSAGRRGSPATVGGGNSSISVLGQFLGASSNDTGRKLQENIDLLAEVVDKHSAEGKELLEETKNDLRKVLQEKANKARKIVENAQESQ